MLIFKHLINYNVSFSVVNIKQNNYERKSFTSQKEFCCKQVPIVPAHYFRIYLFFDELQRSDSGGCHR